MGVTEIMPEVSYTDRVFQLLIDMKKGDVFSLEENVAPDNREKFIEAVKLFIYYNYGFQFGFQVDFNSSYTRLRKY